MMDVGDKIIRLKPYQISIKKNLDNFINNLDYDSLNYYK